MNDLLQINVHKLEISITLMLYIKLQINVGPCYTVLQYITKEFRWFSESYPKNYMTEVTLLIYMINSDWSIEHTRTATIRNRQLPCMDMLRCNLKCPTEKKVLLFTIHFPY